MFASVIIFCAIVASTGRKISFYSPPTPGWCKCRGILRWAPAISWAFTTTGWTIHRQFLECSTSFAFQSWKMKKNRKKRSGAIHYLRDTKNDQNRVELPPPPTLYNGEWPKDQGNRQNLIPPTPPLSCVHVDHGWPIRSSRTVLLRYNYPNLHQIG